MGNMKRELEDLREGFYECPNTGIPIPIGSDPISEEEVMQMYIYSRDSFIDDCNKF